jgi:hypothetical protein
MIYKFKSKKVNSNNEDFYLELTKNNDKVSMSIFDSGKELIIDISKETLYDIIGALHSIQTKINKEAKEARNG